MFQYFKYNSSGQAKICCPQNPTTAIQLEQAVNVPRIPGGLLQGTLLRLM